MINNHILAIKTTANNISQDKASEKFFSDVAQQYDDKLGFEMKLQNFKSEIQKNEQLQLRHYCTITAMLSWIILHICRRQRFKVPSMVSH